MMKEGWVRELTVAKGSRIPVQNNPHEQRNWPPIDLWCCEGSGGRLTEEVTDSADPALVLRAKDVAMRLAGRLAAHVRREPSMVSLHVGQEQ